MSRLRNKLSFWCAVRQIIGYWQGIDCHKITATAVKTFDFKPVALGCSPKQAVATNVAIGTVISPGIAGYDCKKNPTEAETAVGVPQGSRASGKKVLLLQGCVQRAATPNVNSALAQLLAARNVAVTTLAGEGCCGAVDYHLSAHRKGLQRMRELICGATIKEYPMHLSEDAEYASKAKSVIEKVVDVTELLGQFEFSCTPIRAAVHTPCSLQHGQGINGEIEHILERAGITLVESREAHLCCGSAGTYSILQADLSQRLLKRKLAVLQENSPQVIVTANIGCQLHLQSEAGVVVLHWVELLQQQLTDA
jgi:glycolate oxidase iron-sulfur subunit